MKLIKILITVIFILLIGGFIGLGLIDLPVQQQDIVIEIPQEKVLND